MTDKLICDSQSFQIHRKQRTPEGYLDVWGVAARVGVLEYDDPVFPGGKRRELVLPEALRDTSSLEGKPVTIEHPPAPEGVVAETWQKLTKGMVMDASFDEESGEQRVRIRFTDVHAIKLIEDGLLPELSPGYYPERAARSGTHPKHGTYHVVQTGRRNNHLAATRAGRGGPDVGMRLDSQHTEDNMTLEELQARVAELEAERDTLRTQYAELEAERDGLKANQVQTDSHETFSRRFQEHTLALNVAGRLGVEVKPEDETEKVKRACVQKKMGEMIQVDSKSAAYVDYAFDQLAVEVQSMPDSKPATVATVLNDGRQANAQARTQNDSADQGPKVAMTHNRMFGRR